MTKNEASRLLSELRIPAREIAHVKGSFDKDIFIIDGTYILRPSERGIDDQVACFARIGRLDRVPKIVKTGTFAGDKKHDYLLLTQIPGVEYYSRIEFLDDGENQSLGRALAGFLDGLHENAGSAYDVGHYIPIVKNHAGSWREGHARYRNFLEDNFRAIPLPAKAHGVVKDAFAYLIAYEDSLTFQRGPVLLHNDFHPKNIIIENGAFSGVIDWECSQYGEADFDLCHLFHWCLFPPDEGRAFPSVMKAVLGSSASCAAFPDFCVRQTIYQIEQDLLQLMWSKGAAEAARIPRLERWLENGIETFVGGL